MTILPGAAQLGAAEENRLTARRATGHGVVEGYADGRVQLGDATANARSLVREIADLSGELLAVSTLRRTFLLRLPSLSRRGSVEGRLAGYSREQKVMCLASNEGTETALSFLRLPSLVPVPAATCGTPFGVDEVHFSPGEGRYAAIWLDRRQPFDDTLFPLRPGLHEEDRATRRQGRLIDLARRVLIPSFSVESWPGPGGFSTDGTVYTIGDAGNTRRFHLKSLTWEDPSS